MNELYYCNKWNTLYIINYQLDLFLILLFVLIAYGEVIEYLIKSGKAWLHIDFFGFILLKTRL